VLSTPFPCSRNENAMPIAVAGSTYGRKTIAWYFAHAADAVVEHERDCEAEPEASREPPAAALRLFSRD